MKKKTVVIISILAALALLFPIKTSFKDGGTVRYGAVLWSVTKQHSIAGPPIEETNGYNIGTRVRILFWEIYNDVKFAPENAQNGGVTI